MDDTKRNALAELAERMFEEVDGKVLTNPNREDYCKAQRIIAELANIGWWRSSSGWRPRVYGTSEIIIKCREIAEEGATNG